MGELMESVGSFFSEFTDDTPDRLRHGAAATAR
jgi:hypothetical protein